MLEKRLMTENKGQSWGFCNESSHAIPKKTLGYADKRISILKIKLLLAKLGP